MIRRLLLAGLVIGAPLPLGAQEGDLLLLIVGNDTIARELVSRTAARFEGEMLLPRQGARLRYLVDLRPDGTAAAFENRAWAATDAVTAPPRQTATYRFAGDSVHMELSNGSRQGFPTTAGALPFLNPSFGLVELMLARASRLGQDTTPVPVFLVQNGQTIPFVIRRAGPDSMVVDIAGVTARLRVDSRQRILGGLVPTQGLRITRVSGTTGMPRTESRNYSAPAGAPYTATDVTIPTPGGHTLAGTLTLSVGASAARPVPALVTSTGSGLQDRDEALPSVPGYRLFRQVADTLGRHGVAVLRLDDRGYGGSGGDGGTATTRDFAADAAAGLAWLRRRPEIDSGRLGVIGHSEGGLVAPLIAAADSTLRGIILLAAQSRTGRQVIDFQQRQAIDGLPGRTARERDSLFAEAQQSLAQAATSSAWMREFLVHDPVAVARQVRRPAVLIVHGATDRQVTADQAPELEAAFRAAGNPDVTMLVFAEANHLLLQDPDGNPSGYAALPTRDVRPDILGAILSWVTARFLT